MTDNDMQECQKLFVRFMKNEKLSNCGIDLLYLANNWHIL